jgi:glycosyltransferase involved in cell wall biosynthesis
MKFAYVTNTGLTEGWAHSAQIMNMCKAFSDIGVEITLIVPNRSYLKEDPFEYYKIPKTFFIKKLPCVDLSVSSPSPFFYWLRFVSFYISARFYIWFNRFDILYSRDLYSVLFFPNIILEQHSFKKNISLVYKLVFSSPKKIIVITSFIKKKFINTGIPEDRILISPSGVDLSKFNNSSGNFEIKGITEKDFVYGYIGTLKTMNMEKGVADGLRALTLLSPDYKFLVVGGEKTDIEYYKNMSDELGVSDKVIFVGQVPYSDISKYATRCDIFVAPFPENKHYNFYMSPLKIFEYMASKKPIIATDLPSLREILTNEENALLIPPGDQRALANAIIKLKENPEYGREMANKAYLDVSEKYTWKIRAEKIISFIKYAGKK